MTIKNNNNSKKKFKDFINYMIFIFYLFLFVIAIIFFEMGYHAIDTSYNILRISHYENQSYYDKWLDMNLNGDNFTFSEEYTYGWKMISVSISIFLGLFIILFIDNIYRYFIILIQELKGGKHEK